MDPNKQQADLSGVPGLPWLGRGRGLRPREPAVGRSRGLLLLSEGLGVGRARGFPTTGDIPLGRGVTVPPTEPGRGRGLFLQPEGEGFGRARRPLLPAAEPKVGVARGALLPSLEPQQKPIPPPAETTAQDLKTEESLPSNSEEVRARDVCLTFWYFY